MTLEGPARCKVFLYHHARVWPARREYRNMPKSPIDPIRTELLQWMAGLKKYNSRVKDWLIRERRARAVEPAIELLEIARAYEDFRAITVNFVARLTKRFGPQDSRTSIFRKQVIDLDREFGDPYGPRELTFLYEAYTQIDDEVVKSDSEHVACDPTTAVPQTGSVGDHRRTGALAGTPVPLLRLTPVRLDILKIIAASQTTLSKSQVIGAMNSQGLIASEHTVRTVLAEMKKADWLNNGRGRRSPGYGIIELGHSILREALRPL
jgi:hypothetical protein